MTAPLNATPKEGIQVPGWLVGAVVAATALITTGYVAAQKMGGLESRVAVQETKTASFDQRLERIERKQDQMLELLNRRPR